MHIPPPLDLWFWSIYQEEPPSSIILCVLCFVCVCVGSVDIFLTPHTCHDRRSRDPLCKFISHPICVSKRMQMFTEGWYACILKGCGVSDCSALECCQGSRRVRRRPCLSSTAAQTMAPRGPTLHLIERLQKEREREEMGQHLHQLNCTHTNVYVGTLANWHIYVRVVLYKHYTLVVKVLQSYCTFSSKRLSAHTHTQHTYTTRNTHALQVAS